MNYLDKLNFDYGEFRKCTAVFKPKFTYSCYFETREVLCHPNCKALLASSPISTLQSGSKV